ncbi:unnamed protein product [Pieris brassicae]|uniref:Uncharacterized protein n=1 Tax=Pieris brassicae TaxID=7116 RepID=A0A9P0TNP7_PIEBR|nr:unnamed protein product [Pieris brassicae]
MMTLKQLACDEQNNYQNSSFLEVLQSSFYMDDVVHGCHSVAEAKQLQNDLIKLLSSGVLLVGKTRLVPKNKSVTLPRLELSGALLLSKLMATVINCLRGHVIRTYGWVDSTIVLGWLNGDPARWKTFVSKRVQQITEVMPYATDNTLDSMGTSENTQDSDILMQSNSSNSSYSNDTRRYASSYNYQTPAYPEYETNNANPGYAGYQTARLTDE